MEMLARFLGLLGAGAPAVGGVGDRSAADRAPPVRPATSHAVPIRPSAGLNERRKGIAVPIMGNSCPLSATARGHECTSTACRQASVSALQRATTPGASALAN